MAAALLTISEGARRVCPARAVERLRLRDGSGRASFQTVLDRGKFKMVVQKDGFLEERGGLRLVRTEELLERWLSAESPLRS